ncbi:MAG TPA: DinB family protein [Jatrophihabitantaceae bacterium]|nr:DinB family protein [Jatrophihabitantaceae bacterium]
MTNALAQRVDPPYEADEKTTLLAYVDYHRATLVRKCDNLTPEQLATRAVPTSTLSLLGLVRHLAEVERNWADRVDHVGDRPGIYFTEAEPDLDFDGAVADPEVVRQAWTDWQAEVERGREVAQRTPLEATFTHERTGEVISHRWVLIHMVEEYARHNGHADFLREAIDGVTGE